MDSKAVSWTQELYLDFKYYRENGNFHSFEGDDGIFGILFASTEEAEDFYACVSGNLKGYSEAEMIPKKEKNRSRSIFGSFGFGRKSKLLSSSEEEESSDSSSKKEKQKKKNKEKKKDSDLTHDDVSEPRDFTHLSHIGFNPEKGSFDIQNIPDEWKTLFAKAGITQSQLENKSTAKFIAGFVQDTEPQMRGFKSKGKPAVPIPATKKKTAPPPPPPVSSKARKAPESPLKSSTAPPPPPPKKLIKPKAVTSSIPQPPPAPTIKNPTPAAPSGHSALLDSIRGAGLGILKPVESLSTTSVSGSNPHNALMDSIKSGANLRPASKQDRQTSSPTSSVSSTDPTDMMAAMLAKALAARNKKLAASDSEDEEDQDSDDSRW